MRFWRSAPQLLVSLLCGLCLTLVLHACDTTGVSQSSTPALNLPTAQVQSQPTASLPPETEAIVASAAPEGLYNPPRGDVRFVVISDLNSAYGSTDYEPEVDKAIALLPFWQPDVVLCGGDMIAGQDLALSPDQIRAMWAAFDQHMAAPLRQSNLPFGFTIGNHDASGARSSEGSFLFQQERDLAQEYWHDPAHDPGVQFVDRYEFPFYYTFEINNVFVMVWDGSAASIPPEKLDWVETTLASPQAQQANLRILLGHLPLYAVAVGRDEPGEVLSNAEQLREILERHSVHTYISGHQHAYYPAHKGNLQLLHTGILGAGPRPLIDGDRPPQKAITVLDVNFDSPDRTTYTTYDIQTLQQIPFDRLPRFLTGHNGMVLRRDVEIDDLSAAERSVCEQRLSREQCLA
jgi:hypothetical protein